MNDTKPWYMSRTVIASLVGLAFIALKAFGLLPEGLQEASVVEAVLAVTSVLAIVFRLKATTNIAN